jgi:hypothetical protein
METGNVKKIVPLVPYACNPKQLAVIHATHIIAHFISLILGLRAFYG